MWFFKNHFNFNRYIFNISVTKHSPCWMVKGWNSCVGLNIFYSGIEYTEKNWVWLKVRHYPIQNIHMLACLNLLNSFSLATPGGPGIVQYSSFYVIQIYPSSWSRDFRRRKYLLETMYLWYAVSTHQTPLASSYGRKGIYYSRTALHSQSKQNTRWGYCPDFKC